MVEGILRRFSALRLSSASTRGWAGILVILLFSDLLTGCRNLEDRTSEQTLYFYQVQPAISRNGDASTASGIRTPLNLDKATMPLCPEDTPTPGNIASKCPEEPVYIAATSDPSGVTRNRLKAILVTRSDLICSQTEAQIVGTNDLINFTLTQSTTVLAGAGALVTGLTAAKILSGLAAMTNATRSNVNAVFYENAVKAAIIQKMNDLRADKLNSINGLSVNNGSAVPLSKYSTEEMLGDVQAYHDMCSFFAGVNGLTSTKVKPSTGGGDAKPAAPTIKSVSSNNGDITVAWDAPTDSSVVIISYTATATNVDAAKKEKPLVAASVGTETSVDIPHCTADETYTVAVVATNGAGAGAPSKPSNQVTCFAPATPPLPASTDYLPPTKVSASSADNDIDVTFKSPASPESPVRSYSVSATNVDSSQKEKTLTAKSVAAATKVTISSCVPGHSYKVTAVAIYSTGSSKPTAAPTPVKCGSPSK